MITCHTTPQDPLLLRKEVAEIRVRAPRRPRRRQAERGCSPRAPFPALSVSVLPRRVASSLGGGPHCPYRSMVAGRPCPSALEMTSATRAKR